MSTKKKAPSYRQHKASGRGIVTLPDGSGNRKDYLLPGAFNSPESVAEYHRLVAEWQACRQRPLDKEEPGSSLTLAELILRFCEFVQTDYKPVDGKEPMPVYEFRHSLRPLNFLYGHELANEIRPTHVKAVRNLMILGYDHPDYGPQEPLSRKVINKRMGRIKRCFEWGAEEGLVLAETACQVKIIKAIKAGRSQARETEPVKPVPMAFVEQTMAAEPTIIADMIDLQLMTGVRPGELVIMRGVDLDMTGPVWLYTPEKHKTQHHGHSRVIAIGPKGQAIIRRYLKADVQAYLFSPKDAMEARAVILRKNRKTKVQPSQQNRRTPNRRRAPRDRYTTGTYRRAIERAMERADVPRWHPNQLRHTRATAIRKQFGIDAARAVLGHRSPAITEVYAELDQGQAAEVMARIG